MDKYSKVAVGSKVDIQRTDGRVHSALVSGVNLDTKSVTVEWYENGETKGKEIEIDQVFALNPALVVQPKPKAAVPGISKSRISATPSITRNAPKDQPVSTPKATKGKNERPSALNLNNDEETNGGAPPPRKESSSSSVAGRRRSNCVKEVERLKKNREERRAQQQEQKEQRMKLQQEYDPGNQNWEFIQMIREYQDGLNLRQMTMNEPITDHQITVCVRKRPLSKKELAKKEVDVCIVPETDYCVIHECKLKVDLTKYLENHKFWFDYAFDESAGNDLVYRYTAKPLVECIFNQGMATCFAYGQTGSGKTHTMGGTFTGKQQDSSNGIYALAATDVFKLFKHPKHKGKDLVISCSYFEIYGSKVFDLLNKRKKLRVLEDGNQQVQVCELQEKIVHNVQDVLKLIDLGNKLRTSGQTSANQNSSRSHAVFQIVLRKRGYAKDGSGGHLYGKFSLIDLAGNERGADTSTADRQTRLEGAEINKSLLALKECIRALGRKGAHLPFRASKLTQVLRDSFIGENSKTCMIAMISPGMSCCEHTLNTLRYADRVKELGPEKRNRKRPPANGGEVGEGDDEEEVEEDDDDLSPMGDKNVNNVDLALLCTHSGSRDNSQDLYTFHEAVSQLNDIEDKIIDDHKCTIKEAKTLLKEEEHLVERVDSDVDYNVEDYVKRLDEILAQKIQKFTELRDKVNQFRRRLEEEEVASRNIRKLPGY
ncbi:kinesin-like protein KIF2A [Nematostella vectensis]|uniref:kinesin-like protein KIF2A n=1 Tax=Nematostella vectensis TaxID=45351 RepID=UPI0013906738|nr:kinesin-like protein KIF2A [Nematostella vectensis]